MKTLSKNIFLSFLLMFNVLTFGQNIDSAINKSELQKKTTKLENDINSLQATNRNLKSSFDIQKKQIDSLSSQLSITNSNIQQIADSLNITVSNVSSTNINTQNQIQDINKTITTKTLFWFTGIILVALLSIIVFFVLRKKLTVSSKSIEIKINRTNQKLTDEAIKLDSKLVEILQTQLSIISVERNARGTLVTEMDNKLPIQVGNEIHRMRKRINTMDQNCNGITALKNSLQRLEEEFNESGYEMEDHIGEKYIEGMKVDPRFVDNPAIPKGEAIITDASRPEIKYNGVVIQVAKVEVGKSY